MATNEPRAFRTLRGAIAGEEPDEETYFAYSTGLRLFGEFLDPDVVTNELGLTPKMSCRRGDELTHPLPPRGDWIPGVKYPPPWEQTGRWMYSPDVPEEAPLHVHIDTLWNEIKDHKAFLVNLKNGPFVDSLTVFNGYRSNCDHAGVEVPYTSLEMFTELGIPFGVSIIIA